VDSRLKIITKILGDYSMGKFDRKMSVSPKMDNIDAFISGINMLGEELKDKTITKNYFQNILNSVADIIIVLNKSMLIENTNKVFQSTFGFTEEYCKQCSLESLLEERYRSNFVKSLKNLNNGKRHTTMELQFTITETVKIPILASVSMLFDEKNHKKGFIIVAKDFSYQKQLESVVMQTMIDTQEKVRTQLAKDLHDSIGQQLAAAKFYIGACIEATGNEKHRKILQKSNDSLLNTIQEIRNICFDIMPKTLKMFGLVEAVRELVEKTGLDGSIHIIIEEDKNFPALEKRKEIAIYRIIQEFIGNSLKHSKADQIEIIFGQKDHLVEIILKDNGIGFNINKLKKRGAGLDNIFSRIKAYNGNIDIISAPKQGTCFEITIPKT
jgi:PAS domain S-box-containing protein